MTPQPLNQDPTSSTADDELLGIINKFIKDNHLVPSPNPLNIIAGRMKLGMGHETVRSLLAWADKRAEQQVREARVDELEKLGNYKDQYDDRYDLYDTVKARIAALTNKEQK